MNYIAQNITIALNTSSSSEVVEIDFGKYTHCEFIPNTTTEPTSSVNIKVVDSQNDELHPLVSYKSVEHKGGGYTQGMKPVNFGNQRKVKVMLNAAGNLATEWGGQIIFLYKNIEE